MVTVGVFFCSPRGKEVHSSDRRTHMYEQEHTNYTNYKITTGQLSATGPCYGKSSGCCVRVCVCVCAVEPLGSQGPCRALGVLIRQTQPSRVHHREKERIERRERLNRGWWVMIVCRGASKSALVSSGGLWRERWRENEGVSWKKKV